MIFNVVLDNRGIIGGVTPLGSRVRRGCQVVDGLGEGSAGGKLLRHSLA